MPGGLTSVHVASTHRHSGSVGEARARGAGGEAGSSFDPCTKELWEPLAQRCGFLLPKKSTAYIVPRVNEGPTGFVKTDRAIWLPATC